MSGYRTTRIENIFWCGLMALAVALSPIGSAMAADEPEATTSPLKLYNDGTKRLREGKLQEAEACLQGAVASQNERVQSPALYNLGEVRFRSGVVDLKKGPNEQATKTVAQHATQTANEAMQAADQAMAGDDLQAMAEAYLRGRGARKELKSAVQAVKSAMDTYGGVLTKWRRSSGDFKSTFELTPADVEAKTNSDLVEQNIARLVDSQQMMMQLMMGMTQQRGDLGKKLFELKKKMPKSQGDQMKGGSDDDDDEEDGKKPKEPKEGMEEPGPKDGKEMLLTFEEAARLLDMLKLDSNRKLPLGTNEMAKPQDRKGRDW